MSYANKLKEIGIVDSRIDDLNEAMSKLHGALCRLDNQQLDAYGKPYGLIGHLDQFAKTEGLRNVAEELYQSALRRSAKRIDFGAFAQFSDKLYFLAEEAAEVSIPGALMLCRSLRDLRKRYETDKRGLFFQLANQALAHTTAYGPTDREPLRIRNTNKYVGSCRHLDDWTTIGRSETIQSIERKEDCDGVIVLAFVKVTLDQPSCSEAEVKKALRDSYSYSGCAHEHDCCGCISQSVTRLKRLTDDVWALRLSWYRNV